MEVLSLLDRFVDHVMHDDRFTANVVGVGVALAAVQIAWLVLRKLLTGSLRKLGRRAKSARLQWFGQTAAAYVQTALAWLACGLLLGTVVAGTGYHIAGGHIQEDLLAWYRQLTVDELINMGIAAGAVGCLLIGGRFASALVTSLCRPLEVRAAAMLAADGSGDAVADAASVGMGAGEGTDAAGVARAKIPAIEGDNGTGALPPPPVRGAKGDIADAGSDGHEGMSATSGREAFARWFGLLRRYANGMIWLGVALGSAEVVGFGAAVRPAAFFVLQMVSILVVARLLTLAYKALAGPAVEWGDRQFANSRFNHYWERLARLVPLADRCFEAAVYISAASACVERLSFIAFVAVFGRQIVQCIGIFFGARVLVELTHVVLSEWFGIYSEHPRESQKGQTLVPLLQSVAQYVLHFGAALMMLGTLGVNTQPILAGAGIIGLAAGLGSQSLMTDVVSGLFILFENQYLVGDYVEIGKARGLVEAIAVRHTQVRDEYGKLHLIPNGQIKDVVNYSKGYVNAVVEISLPAGSDLEGTLRAMLEAGRQLRQTQRDVLGETTVQGLAGLSFSDMTVRAVTKVRPGTHVAMENEYRRLLKQAWDRSSVSKAA